MIFARENNMKFCFKHKASNTTPQRVPKDTTLSYLRKNGRKQLTRIFEKL